MPRRIQRRRTTGWRMPPGAVYVGRPTKWGNPYRVGDPHPLNAGQFISDARQAVELFRAASTGPGFRAHVRRDLRGRDLACWCALDQPCHADVLLEIANASD